MDEHKNRLLQKIPQHEREDIIRFMARFVKMMNMARKGDVPPVVGKLVIPRLALFADAVVWTHVQWRATRKTKRPWHKSIAKKNAEALLDLILELANYDWQQEASEPFSNTVH